MRCCRRSGSLTAPFRTINRLAASRFITSAQPHAHTRASMLSTVRFKYGPLLGLYNLELSSGIMSTVDKDEFDDRLLKEMAKMFSEMGMPIDVEMLQNMMRQVRQQFEEMGIDPEQMSSTDIRMRTDVDPEEFRKQMETMLSGPGGMGDLFRNMGIKVQFDGSPSVAEAPKIEVDEEVTEESDDELPIEDVFIHEDRMCITVDISRFADIEPEEVELNLTGGGEILQLMKTTQMRPLKRYTLPHSAENIVEWDLNNGILDVKFDIDAAALSADESE